MNESLDSFPSIIEHVSNIFGVIALSLLVILSSAVLLNFGQDRKQRQSVFRYTLIAVLTLSLIALVPTILDSLSGTADSTSQEMTADGELGLSPEIVKDVDAYLIESKQDVTPQNRNQVIGDAVSDYLERQSIDNSSVFPSEAPEEILSSSPQQSSEETEAVIQAKQQLLTTRSCHECDLSGANLQGRDLTDVFLQKAVLQDANLEEANFRNADLLGVNFNSASLANANLSDSNLYGAEFIRANLTNADLRGTDLRNTDFSNAILRGADLSGAEVSSTTNLSSADLCEAIMADGSEYVENCN